MDERDRSSGRTKRRGSVPEVLDALGEVRRDMRRFSREGRNAPPYRPVAKGPPLAAVAPHGVPSDLVVEEPGQVAEVGPRELNGVP